jgi:hypothetical protein
MKLSRHSEFSCDEESSESVISNSSISSDNGSCDFHSSFAELANGL